MTESAGKRRVLVIAGPTASGKTQLSLLLAQVSGGEIISADSMQVYRGLDIGTAKSSPEARALISHHLIDICDIEQSFNVAEFCTQAQGAIEGVLARENVPIVVGGSGFYIHALLYGSPEGPPSVPQVREQLEAQMRELGPEILYERLQMLDPSYAATLTENDRQKIIRALEIIALTEKRVSEFPKPVEAQTWKYDFRCWFIYYSREALYARIERRCEEMIRNGFMDEVKEMEKRGLRNNPSASQAIGYRQALKYLSSSQSPKDFQEFEDSFKRASRQYAKRQFTWFRKEPLFRWLDVERHDPEHLKELILHDFEHND